MHYKNHRRMSRIQEEVGILQIPPGQPELHLHLQLLDNGNLNFGAISGKVIPYYTKKIASSSTKLHISSTKFHLHYPKVEGGNGLQVDLGSF